MAEEANDGSVGSHLALKLQARREEHRKECQRKLEWLLREVEVDWQEVTSLMAVDGLHPNQKELSTGIHTLHRAAGDGQAEVLLWCIKEKADVDARTYMGRSPLHFACDGCRPRCIRILLENHADCNIRSLSSLTPLHLCCQANSLEAVTALLHDPQQVVDIDAEDSRNRRAEALTTDRQILRVLRKYRATLDDRRKALLVEQCLHRLFKFFDVSCDGCIHPEEFVDTMTLLAEFFEHHCDDSIQLMFEDIDKDQSGAIDWDEFKAAHVDLLKVINVPFRSLMDTLADIERAIFQEKVLIDKEAVEDAKRQKAKASKPGRPQPLGEESLAEAQVADQEGQSITVAGIASAAIVSVKLRAPVLTPKAKAMSIRRAAARKVSHCDIEETSAEAMAKLGLVATNASPEPSEVNEVRPQSSAEVTEEDVLPPVAEIPKTPSAPPIVDDLSTTFS